MTKQTPSNLVISFLSLRKLIGILGITLPAILLIGTFTLGKCTQVQDSISHYYYTIMGDVYVGVMCTVGLFLMSYKGYSKTDDIASTLAGIFAVITALFATTNNQDMGCTIRTLTDNNFRINVHYIAAALFFATLAIISIFLFTKSKGHKTKMKIIRNFIYRASGITILVMILIFLYKQIDWLQIHFAQYKPVFWLEWIALLAFGTSWLIKGEFLFEDNKPA
jgi:hypothetical protein